MFGTAFDVRVQFRIVQTRRSLSNGERFMVIQPTWGHVHAGGEEGSDICDTVNLGDVTPTHSITYLGASRNVLRSRSKQSEHQRKWLRRDKFKAVERHLFL